MSYDVSASNGAEVFFSDTHPAFDTDGMAGTAVLTKQGYARCGNYTSNVSGMWRLCLTGALATVPDAARWIGVDARYCAKTWPKNYGDDPIPTDTLRLRDLQGALMADLVPLLTAAVEWGVEHIDELRELNPENGWGNAEGAVTFLWDIQRLCEANPDATLEIWS